MHKNMLWDKTRNWNHLSANDLISQILETFDHTKIALASSFSLEDQVLTHMLIQQNKNFRIFTLDTGRLHQETYDVMEQTSSKFHFHYEICFPDSQDVIELLEQKGPNSFYKNVDNRKECCTIRKVKPLKNKLKTLDAWITGIRKEQSVTRATLQKIEWDDTFNIIKINPLSDWNEQDVWEYIKKHDVPYNSLHDKGYPSIGCAPCTRAVQPGEDIRAGRWWWEEPVHKECGLHIKEGKLVRRNQ